jgi:O-antigen/teichoic acid export membrane protein
VPIDKSLQPKLSPFKKNVVANFIGNSSAPLLSFVFVPFYLRYIGAEGYGLIGIFTSLQVLLSFLDSGLSITLNKELASLGALTNTQTRMRNLVKTLGNVYWLISIIAGIIAVSLSSFMANHWVNPHELGRDTIQIAFVLMSISLVFQLPYGFYSGGLLGLQRHVLLNVQRVSFAVLRSAGALCVLIFYAKTVTAFFGWILLVNIVQVIVLRWSVWHALPKAESKPVFDKQVLKKIWRFAGGITSITIIASLLTQIDKLILSKNFSLSQMGYYTLAQSIAGMIVVFIVPPFAQSLFPQFNKLLIAENISQLKEIYLLNCRRVSYIVIPASIFICFFSFKLLFLYTANESLAKESHLLLSLFLIGFLINATLHLPYNMALAIGFTKKIFRLYLILLVVYIPLLYISLLTGKIINAGIAYIILQSIFLVLLVPLIQNKIKLVPLKEWYKEVIIKPVSISLLFIIPAYFLVTKITVINNTFSFLLFSVIFICLLYLAIEKKYNLFGIFKSNL